LALQKTRQGPAGAPLSFPPHAWTRKHGNFYIGGGRSKEKMAIEKKQQIVGLERRAIL
jgi:hypothetical protein